MVGLQYKNTSKIDFRILEINEYVMTRGLFQRILLKLRLIFLITRTLTEHQNCLGNLFRAV